MKKPNLKASERARERERERERDKGSEPFSLGYLKKPGFFCEGKAVARGKPQCMSEYMRAHGAKSTKLVRAEG